MAKKSIVGNSSKDTDIYNEILYLVHSTDIDLSSQKELRTATDIDNQFPGVYFTLITKHNRMTENVYPGKYKMIFSAELLKQFNYHINIQDHNGIISEKNTYFHWELENAIKQINNNAMIEGVINQNEVVFHDNISMKYLCRIIKRPDILNLNAFLSFKLPEEKCITSEPPDMSKTPFYAFSFENIYTGRDPPPPSSLNFFRKMARLAKISPIPTKKDEIIEELSKKIPYLLTHRDEQNITVLRHKGGLRKTKKRRQTIK